MSSSQMPRISFPTSLLLTTLSPTHYTNTYPPWTWPNSTTIPGGLLISLCAVAALHTVPASFTLDNLQAQFLGKPSAEDSMHFHVTTLSSGRRFCVRSISLQQAGIVMVHVTVGFVSTEKWAGRAMEYSARRKTGHAVDKIQHDDLEKGRGARGGFMRFQRLPLVYGDEAKSVENGIATAVAQIIPPIDDNIGSKQDVSQRPPNERHAHILGILNLSDYHVMDAPLQLLGIPFGLPPIDDPTGPSEKPGLKFGTSLNHSIHFHRHEGFRADRLTYIEVSTAWARDARAMMRSEIFSDEGLLIATCSQEAFHVLNDDLAGKSSWKL